MTGSFRLAVAQAPAEVQAPSGRLKWLQSILPGLADAGADLVLLPELFACGYNIGDLIQDRAEPMDGTTARAIGEMAHAHGIAIHFGFAERAGEQIFNSALCLGQDGGIMCHHRKLIIPPGFERNHFSAGQGCRLFNYRGLRIATLICYDAEFPETMRHVTGLGAELVLVPTALGAQWGWVAQKMIPTRAFENGVYLAYANSAGTENGLEFLGQSLIAAPDGAELARAGNTAEILIADLYRARVTAAQARLPYLHDRLAIKLD